MKPLGSIKKDTCKIAQSSKKNIDENYFSMTYRYCSINDNVNKDMVVKLIPADVNEHCLLLHNWMNMDHVSKYWHQAWSVDRISYYLDNQINSYHHVYIVLVDERPIAYTELYSVREDPLGDVCEHTEKDWGWHLLIGPSDFIGCGLSKGIGHAIMSYLFIVKDAENIFCEPDISNKRMINFTRALEHRDLGVIQLESKKASLMKCSRDDYEKMKFPILTFTPQENNGKTSTRITEKANNGH